MTKKHLNVLKCTLQKGHPKTLERLAADLVCRLVGVRLSVAKSGFQHGSDAGTVGRGGRRLSVECKRYAENSPLDDRNLLGEIDDALRRDGALEAWILVSTRGISQQTEDSLRTKAMTTGVPVIVIDWRLDSAELPTLAALCAWAPEVVEKHYGKVAMTAAKKLSALAQSMVARLSRELSPWAIGYQSLLNRSRERFNTLWVDAAEARSVFGQNVAGGLVPMVPRQSVLSGLNSWWQTDKSVVVVHGAEGMGKTWAVMQWVQGRLDTLPIYLMLPSSAFKVLRGITHASVVDFIGEALYDLTPRSDANYWRARVHRLLQRPIEEGPALLLLVDGVNQEPSLDWERLLQIFEGGAFIGRVRVIVTAQTHFLRERLLGLRRLSRRPKELEVGPYDLSVGGEFDTLLASHGIDRNRLSEKVIEFARVPRMFDLTIIQSKDAAFQGEPTPGRLLWAHARDELGLKAKASLSGNDWENWLQALAARYLSEILSGRSLAPDETGYSLKEIGEMVRSPSGSEDDTARRLYEIVSGAWLEPIPGRTSRYRPKEATIYLALGIAVLESLAVAEQTSAEKAVQVFDGYIDAVRSTSAAAEILASALSILVEKKWAQDSVVPQLVLAALLQSQNAGDVQRMNAVLLAPSLVEPLLHVVEASRGRVNASARHWALTALHEIPSINVSAWDAIANRTIGWVAHIDCPSPDKADIGDEAVKHQTQRLIDAIGTATPGVHRVLGVPLCLHEREWEDLGEYVPQLFLGRPLAFAVKTLVAATVAASVDHPRSAWSGLKWLVMLNPVDRDELGARLYELSFAVKGIQRESGVHARVAKRVSELLLWLTGDEQLEEKAFGGADIGTERPWYRKEYLTDPVKSFFALERRHVDLLWLDERASTFEKLQRANKFLPDPSLSLHESIEQGVLAWGQQLRLDAIGKGGQFTAEEHQFDVFLSWAARVSAKAVEVVVARWFQTLRQRCGEERQWAARKVPCFALLVGSGEIEAIQELRLHRPEIPGDNERFALLNLLQGELICAQVDSQLDLLVSEAEAFITISLADTLRPPESRTVSEFIHRWGLENSRAVEVICNYMWMHPKPMEKDLFDRLLHYALSEGEVHQTIAFMALTACNPENFGRALLSVGWRTSHLQSEYMQHYGGKAILAASSETPLADLMGWVVPWCLLDEAVARGGHRSDLEVAVQAIQRALQWGGLPNFPQTSQISVNAVGTGNFISFEPSPLEPSEDDYFKSLNHKEILARHKAALDSGESFLKNARSAGAVMTTRLFNVDSVKMLVDRCPNAVDRWLDGLREPTQDLILRINSAGGLFLALCESLLDSDSELGVELWHVLRRHLRIRFVGVGEINELLLIPFRVRDSPRVYELRSELYCLAQNTTDKAYQELVLAAVSQGSLAWLESAIALDESASEPFRQKRAIALKGFLPPEASFKPVWREGEYIGSWTALRMEAMDRRIHASQARHWWTSYLAAPDALSAFCAWQIFLKCADKMAWSWMDSDIEAHKEDSELWRLKMLHRRFNESALKSAINEKSSKGSDSLDKHLVGWDAPGSWFSQESLNGLNY